MIVLEKSKDSIEKVAQLLKDGALAVLPTDTVYGFSAIVSASTCERLMAIKGRSETKPFIQLIASPCDIKNYTDDIVPKNLLEKWPGALTLIVNTKDGKTTAFRCPGDEWLRAVISACGKPLYSTSANRSGQPVINSLEDIKKEFSSEISLFVDDGDKSGALPSTIVSIANGTPTILRQGSVII